MAAFQRVVARMSEPSFYSPPPSRVDVHETHVSVVFLAGDRAYKLKKPVRMPFLDYSTPSRRRHFCDEEVRLNRRFAPDIYLGVRAIAERGRDLVLADADDPAALEYAVVMRRFDEQQTLEHLIEHKGADALLVERVGTHVADLHLAAPRAPAGCWTPAYVGERLEENFDTTRSEVGTLLDRLTFDSVRRFSRAFLGAHEDLLEQRIAAGMVRDVHGDLRAGHVVIEDHELSIVDCVEFDERMRHIDVAADLAFLTMDLERLGVLPLAKRVEHAYVARTGDAELHDLLPFYACYRAWVRGKVTTLRIRQLPDRDPGRPELEQRARELFALALRLAWRARLPLLLVLCGVAGSGKSTLAADLSRRSGLPHLSSDHVRKELAGIAPSTRGSQELYTPELTTRIYRELATRATAALEQSGGAIVDATFHRRERRALLQDTGARTLWVECTAPEHVLRSRGAGRERRPQLASDAAWPVIEAQLSAWEPLSEVAPGDHFTVPTDRAVEACLDELDSFVSAAVDHG
jgi:uncharacterized protein